MKYKYLEIELNNCLRQICTDIQKEYPLTLAQRLKLNYIVTNNKVTINSSSDESFINIKVNENNKDLLNHCLGMLINRLFSIIIERTTTQPTKIGDEFYKYVKKCVVEFYTFRYCITHNIKYDVNEEYLIYIRQVLNEFSLNDFEKQEIDAMIFRNSVSDIIKLSSCGNSLFEQYKENNVKCMIHQKKEM